MLILVELNITQYSISAPPKTDTLRGDLHVDRCRSGLKKKNSKHYCIPEVKNVCMYLYLCYIYVALYVCVVMYMAG